MFVPTSGERGAMPESESREGGVLVLSPVSVVVFVVELLEV